MTHAAIAFALQAATLITLGYISLFNHHLGKAIMSTQASVDAVVAQLRKVSVEINSKIADLKLQIDDARVGDVVDTSELEAVAQALDDIVPDVVEDLPDEVVPELPAEVEGEPETTEG